MGEAISMLITLIMAVAVIWLSYRFSKWVGGGMRRKGKGGNIQVMERAALAQDKSIALVRTGKRYFLVGVGPSQVNLLSELSQEDLTQDKGVLGDSGKGAPEEDEHGCAD